MIFYSKKLDRILHLRRAEFGPEGFDDMFDDVILDYGESAFYRVGRIVLDEADLFYIGVL